MLKFVAIQKGVYRHNLVGVFENRIAAEKGAVEFLKKEPDHYHHVEIIELEEGRVYTEDKVLETVLWFSDRYLVCDGRYREGQAYKLRELV